MLMTKNISGILIIDQLKLFFMPDTSNSLSRKYTEKQGYFANIDCFYEAKNHHLGSSIGFKNFLY